MPQYVRWRELGATYFFTVVTFKRRRLFAEPSAHRCLRRAFVEVRRRWPFDMFACVLLPEHLHCIWTMPDGDDDFPVRWANIKRLFTKAYLSQGGVELPVTNNRRKHNERGVWQQRFWEHRIRSEAELYAYRDYIHLNPVKHGLVDDPMKWPWSSVHRHMQMGWLESDWTGWTPIKLNIGGE